jgi:hypothetical protein
MDTDHDATPAEQLASGALALGLVSLLTCWWFPFGAILGCVGTGMGVAGWRTPDARRALLGTILAACGTCAGLLLAWEFWRRLLGA